MTKEDKELLLKDLCARLPYGVKVHLSRKHNRPEEDIVLNNVIVGKDSFVTSNIIGYNYLLSEIKPYLRPMSSMTEEERKEYAEIWASRYPYMPGNSVDFFNAHHLDYHELIEKGLALKALEGMYNES